MFSQLPPSLQETLWWSDLSNALLIAATTKGVRVRMLISRWNHTSARMEPYLQSMATGARACKGGYPT